MRINKVLWFSAAHKLDLPYDSPCTNIHGHNYKCIVNITCPDLNEQGMILDFAKIKQVLMGKFDHVYLNEVVDYNPTAENMAFDIKQMIKALVPMSAVVRITLNETASSSVEA